MTDASEWRHIDPEDVDLVLCRDPFGKPLYDARKASSMVDIFDSIHHAVRPRDGSKHLDFIIVTEVDCLTELKETRDHDLLEEVVLLSTSENQPIDLTSASYKSSEQVGHKVDFTRYENQSEHSSNNVRITLTQDPKTTVALHTGRDISPLSIPNIDSTKKSGHMTAKSLTLDHRTTTALHTGRGISASLIPYIDSYKTLGHVTANTPQLNLTTTSALHEKRGISTSLIPSKNSTKKSGHVTGSVFWENNAGLQLPIANVPSLQVVRSVQSVIQYGVMIDSDKESCYIWGCCMLPGGEILLADYNNSRLKKLDSAYNVISVCNLSGDPRGVCYIGNNVAVVCVFLSKLVYVDVSSMTVRNTVTTDHRCDSITCHNDKLYVTYGDTVYMYTLDGNNRSTLYKLQYSSFNFTGIAVSGDGNRIYITDENDRLITIDRFGNLLNSLTLPDGEAGAVCVDDRGNVWAGDIYDNKLYQVSADGARLLGTVSVDELYCTPALCYDRDRSSLIVAGYNDNIHVVQLD